MTLYTTYVWALISRLSSGLLYHGLPAATNRLLPLDCPISMDQLCPVCVVHSICSPIFLSGWRFCAWNGYPSKFWWSTCIHGCNFNRFQPKLLVGILRRSGTRQSKYGPGVGQNTTCLDKFDRCNPTLWLVLAKRSIIGFEKRISSPCSWLGFVIQVFNA